MDQENTQCDAQTGDITQPNEAVDSSVDSMMKDTTDLPNLTPTDTAATEFSPVQTAHVDLINSQVGLHEKLLQLAKRLEDVLGKPFKGTNPDKETKALGTSPVSQNLATSTMLTGKSTEVVDHLLSNLEV